MSDVSEFLNIYSEMLREKIAETDMPLQLKESFAFDSLVKQQAGREVYFVVRKADDRRAVLRVTNDEIAERAMMSESSVLRTLDHPAIPKLFGAWRHEGRGYLVREYFDGDDLHSYMLRHGTLSFDMLTDISLCLCDVLTYIHGRQPPVVHRNIKPENIILAKKNDIKLIDFGIARNFREEATGDTPVAGMGPYMAPEQFGGGQTDNRADIYSLGVVMIYMATGRTDRTNLRDNYPHRSLIPIIEKCIRKDRDHRHKSAEQLKRSILRVRDETR